MMELDSVEAKVVKKHKTYYGPGTSFVEFKPDSNECPVYVGETVTVLGEIDGWVFIDWHSPIGRARLWIPADYPASVSQKRKIVDFAKQKTELNEGPLRM